MKRKLFWILYYSIIITFNVVSTILFRAYWCFDWTYSIFPILYFIFSICILCICFIGRIQDKSNSFQLRGNLWANLYHLRFDKDLGVIAEERTPYYAGHKEEREKFIQLAPTHFLFLAPLYLFPIFFFSPSLKILSGVPCIIIFSFDSIYAYVFAKNQRFKKLQEERREQERREELGKWN